MVVPLPRQIPALLKAVTTLPPAAVFPAFDVLRALFLHPDGAMAACEKPNGLAKQALERVLALGTRFAKGLLHAVAVLTVGTCVAGFSVCAVTAGDTPVATVVLGWRCVANMFNGPGKALLIDHMDELIAAATPLLASPKKTLRLTGVTVLRKYVFVHAHACAWLVSVHHMWCVVPLCPQLRNAAARAGGGH